MLALLGIALVAANLRTAVTSASPIAEPIMRDVPLGISDLGLIGMLPPICFAVFGILTPYISRTVGLDRASVAAMVAMTAGNAIRATAHTADIFLLGSGIAFAGIGVANVLLPPLVKKYFPDRIALLSTVYAVLLAVSTLVPPLVAEATARSAGWRASLAIWALVAFIGAVPWVVMSLGARRRERDVTALRPVAAVKTAGMLRSRVAWCIVAIFAVGGLNVYAMFAWLPQLLIESAGVSTFAAGGLLALYAAMAVPMAAFVPALAVHPRNARIFIVISALCFSAGSAGLLLAPSSFTTLWVAMAGLGQLILPIPFVLITVRTMTESLANALSGFVQGVGYAIAAAGPFLFGFLRAATGSWQSSLIVLVVLSALTASAAIPLGRPVMVEDEMPDGT